MGSHLPYTLALFLESVFSSTCLSGENTRVALSHSLQCSLLVPCGLAFLSHWFIWATILDIENKHMSIQLGQTRFQDRSQVRYGTCILLFAPSWLASFRLVPALLSCSSSSQPFMKTSSTISLDSSSWCSLSW